ncbi:hypothetical protein GC093_00515 [Paenibacillus sp. LMG 31456]|uniref:Copper amine oxidase-like N-terminal domain-containing protein n=1 Tax=Paenibacillus foliorum TaxID=2654974 RepID=A0A972GJ59_9BACL|nr:stalk domain-containing protein [Paenibacillus foliorum]NOU91722.1 hypothetical protein [Paenibacillus foliorum]
MLTSLIKKIIIFCLILILVIPVTPASSVWAESIVKDPELAIAIWKELKKSAAGEELKLEDLQKLKSLYPKNTDVKITNLQGLEHAVNMQSMFLTSQAITDIKPIRELKNLTFLAISGNQITDLTPLSSLSRLQKLVIDNNQIQSLEPLEKLPQLTDLLASGNEISDLSPVNRLQVKWLILSNNQIQNLEPLRNHPTLENLYLNDNQIQDIEVLETLPNLKTISLKNNPLTEQAGQILHKLQQRGVNVEDLDKKKQQQVEGIKVSLNAEPVAFDIAPFIKDGNTLVPFRPIFEKLGLKINWNEDTKTITGEKEGITIRLTIDQPIAEVNGLPIQLPIAPTLVSGSTFVPLRFVAEAVESTVEWDAVRQMAIIRSKQDFISSDGTFQVSVYGKWTPYTSSTQSSVKMDIREFNWNTFAVSAIPKQELPQGINLDQFYKNIKTQILADSESKTYLVEEKEEIFQSYPAKRFVYHRTEEGWKNFVYTILFFEANGSYFRITTGANEEILKNAQVELQGIVESFKFIKN